MLSEEEKRLVSNLWDAGLSPGEISEKILDARFFESLRSRKIDVDAYLEEKDQ